MTDAKIEELKREIRDRDDMTAHVAKLVAYAETLTAQLSAIRDAGDEEVDGRAGDIKKWTDTLLTKYAWEQLDIEGQVLVKDTATFAKEIAEFAISRGQQIRERDAEIERLKGLLGRRARSMNRHGELDEAAEEGEGRAAEVLAAIQNKEKSQ